MTAHFVFENAEELRTHANAGIWIQKPGSFEVYIVPHGATFPNGLSDYVITLQGQAVRIDELDYPQHWITPQEVMW